MERWVEAGGAWGRGQLKVKNDTNVQEEERERESVKCEFT